MHKQLVIFFLIVLIAVAYGCVCTKEYMPVCDNEGHQHNNFCLFRCAAVKAAEIGKGLQ